MKKCTIKRETYNRLLTLYGMVCIEEDEKKRMANVSLFDFYELMEIKKLVDSQTHYDLLRQLYLVAGFETDLCRRIQFKRFLRYMKKHFEIEEGG